MGGIEMTKKAMEGVELLAKKVGFGLAAVLLWNKLPEDFVNNLSFNRLEEVCHASATPSAIRDKALSKMIEIAEAGSDFKQWATIFILTPDDGWAFTSDKNEKTKRDAMLKMVELAGDDFNKLHLLARVALNGRCAAVSSFRDFHEMAVRKMNGMKMDFEAWYAVYKSWGEGTDMRRYAYWHLKQLAEAEVEVTASE